MKDFAVIENDPEVDVVVETIGGATIAWSLPSGSEGRQERGLLQQGAGGHPRLRAAAAGQGARRELSL